MPEPIIQIDGLSKRYRLGAAPPPGAATFAETAWRCVCAPLRRWRSLREADGGADEFWALRDVSFDVHPGEVVGVVGRNGAGKSTLLKILSRISEPTRGRAVLRGRVVSLLEVGTGFHPELTGRENIYLNGAILGMRNVEIANKFDEIVEFAEIGRFLDTPVKRYSSGMRVRLGFAVAAHLEPEILIVDEVLAVGDLAFQRKCLGKMDDVARGGRTILFVSHNMAAVEALCSRAVLLEGGRLVMQGAVGDVVSRYLAGLCRDAQRPVAERRDRDGDGSARCTEAWFEDAAGRRVDAVQAGQSLRVCLRYESLEPAADLDFAVGIYDRLGVCLAHNGTQYVPIERQARARRGVMVCRIERLPLPAGEYFVNVSILRDGARADRVERAASFTVEPGDYYGSGRIPPAVSGKTLLDYQWFRQQGDFTGLSETNELAGGRSPGLSGEVAAC